LIRDHDSTCGGIQLAGQVPRRDKDNEKMPKSKHLLLTTKLTTILKKGIPLTPSVLQFMNSTLGITTPSELEDLAATDTDGQADSLIELIFFPDEPLQVQIEQILSQEQFTSKDQKKVLTHLLDTLPRAAILFPDHPQKAHIPLPESAASKFLNRLKITKQLHNDLAVSLTRHIEPNHVPLVRVKLRNASFSYTENNISFLRSYVKAFGPRPDDFFDSFDFTLAFLQELQTDIPIYPALMKKKESCFQNLKKAQKFEQQLEKYNIETLMLRGIRNPCINTDDMKTRIDIIDRIALAVFNKIESIGSAQEDLELKTPF